jgi:hypothetical protein
MCRANHYEGEETARLSRQDLSGSPVDTFTTGYRIGRMEELLRQHQGNLNPAVARAILTDRDGPWPWLHQYPEGEQGRVRGSMTLDSLVAVCGERTLHTCRGGPEPGPWQTVQV